MTEGEDASWGPDPLEPGIEVCVTRLAPAPLAKTLGAVRALRERLGAPVQVVRADRVASWEHLVMAAEHARRAARHGRMRASDPAVEFLLYAAGDRQIDRAVALLGFVPEVATEVVLVALAPVPPEHLATGMAAAGFEAGRRWHAGGDPRALATQTGAVAWWATRLGGVDPSGLDDALLARLALLAVERV